MADGLNPRSELPSMRPREESARAQGFPRVERSNLRAIWQVSVSASTRRRGDYLKRLARRFPRPVDPYGGFARQAGRANLLPTARSAVATASAASASFVSRILTYTLAPFVSAVLGVGASAPLINFAASVV